MLVTDYYIILSNYNRRPAVTLTSHPEWILYWREADGDGDGESEGEGEWIWDHPYPLWLAELISQLIKAVLQNHEATRRTLLRKLQRMIRRAAKSWGWSARGKWALRDAWGERDGLFREYPGNTFCDNKGFNLETAASGEGLEADFRLEEVFQGRVLTLQEIRRILFKRGWNISPCALEVALQRSIRNGTLLLRAGVGPERLARFTCRRCGSIDRVIKTYADDSPYSYWRCEACRSMGVITSSTPLFFWVGRSTSTASERDIELLLPKLTPWQEAAAGKGVEFWEESGDHYQRTLLVWAVCGAGKTEVVFPVIQRALAQGKKVLLTVPRREVAAELGNRVEKAFAGMEFALLYGGRKQEPSAPGLTVSTTHQLLRFTGCFDLAVLDEADAYPFRYDPMLARALQRSLRPGGKLIYMTATPDAVWRRRAEAGKIGLITIPLRHHGHPLPVPTIKRLRLPEPNSAVYRDSVFPREITEFLKRAVSAGRRVLIFAPTVRSTEAVGNYLKSAVDFEFSGQTAAVHSRDAERDDKLKAFAEKKLRILATTTLLERGLTFPDLDALVLYADYNQIFTCETLVQIAGRVGRTAESPGGTVAFFAEKISREMREAKTWIQEMNNEARRQGLLKNI